jgi:hypothetical protein
VRLIDNRGGLWCVCLCHRVTREITETTFTSVQVKTKEYIVFTEFCEVRMRVVPFVASYPLCAAAHRVSLSPCAGHRDHRTAAQSAALREAARARLSLRAVAGGAHDCDADDSAQVTLCV